MAKIKDLIPEDFFDVFASKKYRETYFLYLKALFSRVSGGSYTFKGLTKDACKEIVRSIPVEEYPDDVDVDDFDNKYLSNLVKKGWLKSDYNASKGEDLITFPPYSSLFIEVIYKLDNDISELSEANLRSIYSTILAFSKFFNSDNREISISYLNDACDQVGQLCIRLTSLNGLIADIYNESFKNISAEENIYRKYINFVDEITEKVNAISQRGTLERFIDLTLDEINAILEEISSEKSIYQTLNDEGISEEDKKIIETDQRYWEDIDFKASNLYREMNKARKLYSSVIESMSEATEKIAKKAQFRELYNNAESADQLSKILSYLGKNDDEKTQCAYDKLAEILSVGNGIKLLGDSSLKIQKKAAFHEFKPVLYEKPKEKIDKNITLDELMQLNGLFSEKEVREFEEFNTYNGRTMITAESIVTIDDFYKMIQLWYLISVEYKYSDIEYEVGNKVNVNNMFVFNEFSYIRKENQKNG